MPLRSPSSQGFFRVRLAWFDVVWATVCPPIALYLSAAQAIAQDAITPFALYCSITLVCSLFAFVGFRLRDGLTQYFTVNDAIDISKAVIVAQLFAATALFLANRLEGIPRSALVVHALVLAAGLVLSRLVIRMTHPETKSVRRTQHAVVEHILMIGATRLTAQYMRLLDTFSSHGRRVVALLDERPERIGRSIFGVKVVGPPHEIEATISEYALHGIRIDRIIVGGDEDLLSNESFREILAACNQRRIKLDFVPALIGLHTIAAAPPEALPDPLETPTITLPSYFRYKRAIDTILAIALMVLLSPLIVITCALTLLDVGSPIFFWQQRAGRGGYSFLLYKIRTLRPPFDWRGQAVPDSERLSSIGKLLRKIRLDEFPQLLNVLVGDMSLIGPRPLLPEDQPEDTSIRLLVRPGITGWAQVNGGTLLTPTEKNKLDEWYVRNASFGLDLRIIALTIRFLFKGDAPRPSPTRLGRNAALKNKTTNRGNVKAERVPSNPTDCSQAVEIDGNATLVPVTNSSRKASSSL